MIDLIENLFEDRAYNIEKCEKIVLFSRSEGYPEDCVEIIERETPSLQFIVAEVHRQEKQIKAVTAKEEEAHIYAAIVYKRLFENAADRRKSAKILDFVDSGKAEEALKYAICGFEHSIYAIGHEDPSKISLLQTADTADVKFDRNYIAENAALRRGYAIFYHYCAKLQYITAFCNKIQRSSAFDINRQKLIRLYMFGAL